MFKKLMASVGIGIATVDTIVKTVAYFGYERIWIKYNK